LTSFCEIETDGGLLQGPGGRRQVNGLEGGSSKGFVERVFELKADLFIVGNGKVVEYREEN